MELVYLAWAVTATLAALYYARESVKQNIANKILITGIHLVADGKTKLVRVNNDTIRMESNDD